jgi:hypothetical protein
MDTRKPRVTESLSSEIQIASHNISNWKWPEEVRAGTSGQNQAAQAGSQPSPEQSQSASPGLEEA